MKHLQTFERFYDLNDDIGAADPNEVPEGKIIVDMENIHSIPEINQIITEQDSVTINDYFKEVDGDNYEELNDIVGKTVRQAAEDIDQDFADEWMQHFVIALYPEKYEGVY